MADATGTGYSQTHDTNMNLDAAGQAGAPSPLQEIKRTKVVQLSGPIKIILSDSDCEDTKNIDAGMNLDALAPRAPVDTDRKSMADELNPSNVDARDGHKTDHDDCEVSTSNTGATIPVTPTVERVEEFDCNNPDNTLSPFCPYIPGNEILLKSSEDGTPIKAVIIKQFPATLSCCMVLRFVEPPVFNNTSECVLKLYDRRFSTQLREDVGAKPWTPETEQQYRGFVDCDDGREYFSYWSAVAKQDDVAYLNRKRWSAAKFEAYLQFNCTEMYYDEKKAYEIMSDLQGGSVPKIFGEVVLDQPYAFKELDEDEKTEVHEYLTTIPGVLMQHIDGFHLTDIHKHLPSEYWQSVLDSAIHTIGKIQACGIFNRDVNTRSIMVDPQTREVMMIDFGMVRFREDFESDRDWEELQACHDEEGAIGMLMPMYLKRDTGITVYYNRSERARRLDWRFMREEGEHEGGTEEEDEYVRQDILYDQKERGLSEA